MAEEEFKHTYTYDDLLPELRQQTEEGVRLCEEAIDALCKLGLHCNGRRDAIGDVYEEREEMRRAFVAVRRIKNAIIAVGLAPLMQVKTKK
jgi:hypothetical protein